jgi:selenide,water dikinase
MPIVDDPFEFGRIASANAISDVYAMGGKPILAIAILGWPIKTLSSAIARRVIEGSRSICLEAGIPLAGGHSIDSPEPIFGLAVNGLVSLDAIKQNNSAKKGDYLLLTKPIGVGILTTAEKKGILQPSHTRLAPEQMMQLNKVGEALGKIGAINAMTDVTGFGLLGHLVEMADGSGLSAEVVLNQVPLITEELDAYISQKSVPGGTHRNWDSYGHRIRFNDASVEARGRVLLADPQTSGGLLISVSPEGLQEVQEALAAAGLSSFQEPIGRIVPKEAHAVSVG